MKNRFGQTEAEFLTKYNANEFERPSISVDDLFLTINEIPTEDVRKLPEKKLQVLLLKRSNHPCIGSWTLPGVFLKTTETLEEASHRALEEKTEFRNIYFEQLYTFGDLSRDPRTRVVSVAYMSLVAKNTVKIKEDTQHEETKWFTIDLFEENEDVAMIFESDLETFKVNLTINGEDIEIKNRTNIGFDHAKIIYYGILRLRNKIEYSNIAFKMLPESFTFAESQQVFELILNKKFTKANFQRKIRHRVIETENYKTGGFRPAKLYKLNENVEK